MEPAAEDQRLTGMRVAALLLLSVVAMTACSGSKDQLQGQEAGASVRSSDSSLRASAQPFRQLEDGSLPDSPCQEEQQDEYDVVGLREAEARDRAERDGKPFRVVCIDGRAVLVTADLIEGRVNVHLRDGVVVSSEVEQSR